MFELATKLKIRFPFKGSISTEDLWDLSLKDLDAVYRTISAQVKALEEPSLLGSISSKAEILLLQQDVVKHIFKVKQEEKKATENAASRAAEKQKLLEILASKKTEALFQLSIEELTARINSL